MANVPKAITDLPVASAMGDDDLLVVSQNATTSSIKGELIKGYAQNAVASQVTAAQTAANQAGQSATQAEAARQGAAAAQTAAESAQDAAETARDQSVAAAGTIGDSVEQAQTAAGQASSAKDAAVAAQSAAETAKTAAETASGQAQTAATQAAGSATAAQTAATQAGDAKTDAETARNEAETSASSAANSASDAESAATEAEQAKTYIENMDMEGETLPAGSSVTVTKTTSPEGNLLFVIGVPQGTQGDKGETGATGPQGVSVTNATVNEDGDLVITLSSGSPINAGSVIGPQGIQGEVGPTGASVDRIERTSGTGAPGTTDTYTVYLTDGQTGGTFQVYNGSNGTGSGDFMADGSVPMTGDLQMGGHKITNLAEPTDNTDAASKEYVDDTITVSLVGNYIPTGQKGQANGVASLDGSGRVPNEQLPPMDYVPTSRTVNGHALSADVTLDADDVGAIPNPSGGTTGQVLTKTYTGEEWSDAPSGLPEGGTEGQVLKKGTSGAEWDNADWLPLSGGIMDNAVKIQWGTSKGASISSGVITPELRLSSQSINYVSTNLFVGGVPDTGNNVAYLNYDNNELRLHLGGKKENTVGRLTGLKTPVSSNEATPKSYVDTQLSTKLTTPTGTAGQLLGFTSDNTVGAVDAPDPLPSGGTTGQMLYQGDSGPEWGDKPVMYVNITGSEGNYQADKTFAEIYEAFQNGGVIFAIYDTLHIPVYLFAGNQMVMFCLYNSSDFISVQIDNQEQVYVGGSPISSNKISFTPGTTGLTSENVQDAIEEVQANVDAYKPDRKTITLTTSGWSSNTQTVTVSGVSATETAQLITPTPAIASQSAYYEAGIMCTGQAANSLTFTCQTVPTSNLTVYVVIQPLS